MISQIKSVFIQAELRMALQTICTCVAHDQLTSGVADRLYAKIDEKQYITVSLVGVSSWLTDLYYIQSFVTSDTTLPEEVSVLVQILIDAFVKLQSVMQSGD